MEDSARDDPGRPAGRGNTALRGLFLGALVLCLSPVFLDLSGASPGTATFWRCAFAVPVLALIAVPEARREGRPSRGRILSALVAGVLFAGDALLWTQAIGEVGAGLSTVLVNIQVALVPLLARLIDREALSRRFLLWLPPLAAGVFLTSGVLDQGATGSDPVAGTVHALLAALCYSVFLFLLRRGGGSGQARQTYVWVTASATVTALAAGLLHYGLDFTPGAHTFGWIAAVSVSSQIIGWLLVAVHSPRLASHVGAVLLLLPSVGALVLGAVILGERPTFPQLAGCVLILVAAYFPVRERAPDA